jgi:hypothetical protein
VGERGRPVDGAPIASFWKCPLVAAFPNTAPPVNGCGNGQPCTFVISRRTATIYAGSKCACFIKLTKEL